LLQRLGVDGRARPPEHGLRRVLPQRQRHHHAAGYRHFRADFTIGDRAGVPRRLHAAGARSGAQPDEGQGARGAPQVSPLDRQVPRGHPGARLLRLDGRAAPRGVRRRGADAAHRRRRDRVVQLRRPGVHGEEGAARGRPRPAPGGHGAQHRGFARAALKEVLFYFQELDADAKLAAIAARLIRVFRSYMARRSGADEASRVETLARVFRNAAAVVIVIVAGTLVLGELGISIAPILATAGVAGVAIGFGAQSLIKDYFNGFFLLLDDQVREGDVVEVAGKAGLVEEVTLRYVRLRDFEGHVHFVPNGEIKVVTNRTRGYAHAVIEVGIAYEADIDKALAVMLEVG